ncbi:MAG: hypothetical protein ACKO37_02140, partial [Vampirovibrionales bacterium]
SAETPVMTVTQRRLIAIATVDDVSPLGLSSNTEDVPLMVAVSRGSLRHALLKLSLVQWGIVIGFALLLWVCLRPSAPHYTLDTLPKALPMPLQRMVSKPYFIKPLTPEVVITAKAAYEVDANILSFKPYDTWLERLLSAGDPLTSIIPVDVALVWGIPWTEEAKAHIQVWQRDRWYYYQWDGASPYNGETLKVHSSNHHLIPANETIRRVLQGLRPYTHVYFKGYLVDVHVKRHGQAPYTLASSTTREDSGGGACEIMYVTDVWLGEKHYE